MAYFKDQAQQLMRIRKSGPAAEEIRKTKGGKKTKRLQILL